MKVVGIQEINYDKKDGTHVEGVSVHCIDDTVNKDVRGILTRQYFFSVNKSCCESLKTLPLDTDILVFYNKYGKPDSYEIINN